MTNNAKQILKKEFEMINRSFEKKYFPKVLAAIKSKTSSLISIVRNDGIDAGIRNISTDLTNKILSNTIGQLYIDVGLRYARSEYIRQRDEIRTIGFPKHKSFSHKQLVLVRGVVSTSPYLQLKGFGFNAEWTAFIIQYLQMFLLQKITFYVNKTTRDALIDVLNEGIVNGWSIDEMVKRLEELPFTRVQAARITRTEINRAANVGIMAGVDTSEYAMNKEWIAAHDSRTRGFNPKDHADHYNMDGIVVDFNDPFKDKRNGDELRFPGDPNASAASTINCRCRIVPIAKRDENGKLVPRPQPAVVAPMLGIIKPPIAASPNIGLRVSG